MIGTARFGSARFSSQTFRQKYSGIYLRRQPNQPDIRAPELRFGLGLGQFRPKGLKKIPIFWLWAQMSAKLIRKSPFNFPFRVPLHVRLRRVHPSVRRILLRGHGPSQTALGTRVWFPSIQPHFNHSTFSVSLCPVLAITSTFGVCTIAGHRTNSVMLIMPFL